MQSKQGTMRDGGEFAGAVTREKFELLLRGEKLMILWADADCC